MSPAAAPALSRITIVGPGVYGLSFAAWAARCGLEVRLVGRDTAQASAGIARIRARWEVEAAKGRMTVLDAAEADGRLAAVDLEAALEGSQVLLEALPEDRVVKSAFWRGVAAWEGLRLSGSSSIPMGLLAREAGLHRPILGFHGFVPVDRMSVVEIAVPQGVWETDRRAVVGLAAHLGKRPAWVKDQAGFAASRMALAQGLEAMRLLEAGAASRDDLDALMVDGYGHPAGPLELSDRVGLDLRLAIAKGIFQETGNEAFQPPAILHRLVEAGHTGRIVGRGFYEWDAQGRKQ